jgi:hypothetical protein
MQCPIKTAQVHAAKAPAQAEAEDHAAKEAENTHTKKLPLFFNQTKFYTNKVGVFA